MPREDPTPDELLAEIRAMVASIMAGTEWHTANDLAWRVDLLDGMLTGGAPVPEAWKPRPEPRSVDTLPGL